jgi:hypothetical protein
LAFFGKDPSEGQIPTVLDRERFIGLLEQSGRATREWRFTASLYALLVLCAAAPTFATYLLHTNLPVSRFAVRDMTERGSCTEIVGKHILSTTSGRVVEVVYAGRARAALTDKGDGAEWSEDTSDIRLIPFDYTASAAAPPHSLCPAAPAFPPSRTDPETLKRIANSVEGIRAEQQDSANTLRDILEDIRDVSRNTLKATCDNCTAKVAIDLAPILGELRVQTQLVSAIRDQSTELTGDFKVLASQMPEWRAELRSQLEESNCWGFAKAVAKPFEFSLMSTSNKKKKIDDRCRRWLHFEAAN